MQISQWQTLIPSPLLLLLGRQTAIALPCLLLRSSTANCHPPPPRCRPHLTQSFANWRAPSPGSLQWPCKIRRAQGPQVAPAASSFASPFKGYGFVVASLLIPLSREILVLLPDWQRWRWKFSACLQWRCSFCTPEDWHKGITFWVERRFCSLWSI